MLPVSKRMLRQDRTFGKVEFARKSLQWHRLSPQKSPIGSLEINETTSPSWSLLFPLRLHGLPVCPFGLSTTPVSLRSKRAHHGRKRRRHGRFLRHDEAECDYKAAVPDVRCAQVARPTVPLRSLTQDTAAKAPASSFNRAAPVDVRRNGSEIAGQTGQIWFPKYSRRHAAI